MVVCEPEYIVKISLSLPLLVKTGKINCILGVSSKSLLNTRIQLFIEVFGRGTLITPITCNVKSSKDGFCSAPDSLVNVSPSKVGVRTSTPPVCRLMVILPWSHYNGLLKFCNKSAVTLYLKTFIKLFELCYTSCFQHSPYSYRNVK